MRRPNGPRNATPFPMTLSSMYFNILPVSSIFLLGRLVRGGDLSGKSSLNDKLFVRLAFFRLIVYFIMSLAEITFLFVIFVSINCCMKQKKTEFRGKKNEKTQQREIDSEICLNTNAVSISLCIRNNHL